MRIIDLACVASLLVTPLAAAAQTHPVPVAAEGKVSKDPNRVICRTMDTTGSRLGKKKECHTAAEWTDIQAVLRRDLDKFQANRSKSN
jgi:hypothetical protein